MAAVPEGVSGAPQRSRRQRNLAETLRWHYGLPRLYLAHSHPRLSHQMQSVQQRRRIHPEDHRTHEGAVEILRSTRLQGIGRQRNLLEVREVIAEAVEHMAPLRRMDMS